MVKRPTTKSSRRLIDEVDFTIREIVKLPTSKRRQAENQLIQNIRFRRKR